MPDPTDDGGMLFAAGVRPSHPPAAIVQRLAQELRQPLSAIESIAFYLEMVLPRTEGKARRQLSNLRRQVQEIHWILADAIQFLGPTSIHPQPLDLNELVRKNLSEWRAAGEPQVELHLGADLPPVQADAELAGRMLANLFKVFRGTARAGDVVTIATSAADRQVKIEIQSTAPGHQREELNCIADPFGSQSCPRWALALAAARRIALAHGGSFEVQAEPLPGASAVVALPAVRSA